MINYTKTNESEICCKKGWTWFILGCPVEDGNPVTAGLGLTGQGDNIHFCNHLSSQKDLCFQMGSMCICAFLQTVPLCSWTCSIRFPRSMRDAACPEGQTPMDCCTRELWGSFREYKNSPPWRLTHARTHTTKGQPESKIQSFKMKVKVRNAADSFSSVSYSKFFS